MTEVELDQFMADYHPQDDTIEVNCNWLQELIRLNTSNTRDNIQLRREVIELQEKLDIYKELYSCYRPARKVLKTNQWSYPTY